MSRLSFRDAEALRLAAASPFVFGYETDGVMLAKGHGHANLHESLRHAALDYFAAKKIQWWRSTKYDADEPPGPTRLLRSSQVAAVNHLQHARDDPKLALPIARAVVPDTTEVLPIDDGFVAFEWIGKKANIGERPSSSRGSNRTNIDALLVVLTTSGKRVGIVIEWKLAESYGPASLATSKNGTDRVAIYRNRLEDPAGPIAAGRLDELGDIFYDPFEQLARQTLLAWRLAVDDDLYDDWRHVHVIPQGNRELIERVTAPKLVGTSMPAAWRTVLCEPERYHHATPTQLLRFVGPDAGPPAWRSWLAVRYAT